MKKRKRGLWSVHEDQKLLYFITTFGVPSWSSLPNQAVASNQLVFITGLERCAKSCRLRWMNHLRPELKRVPISQEEEEMIIALHKIVGNRWALIAERMSGRTDNKIKNYYDCRIKKKQLKDERFPNTHDLLSRTILHKSEPTSDVLEFQSNSETNLNDHVFTSNMLRFREIGIIGNDTFSDCNKVDCKSEAQTNQLSLKSDYKETLKQDLDLKRLEEYVNALSALLC